jgi:hypothetical protein
MTTSERKKEEIEAIRVLISMDGCFAAMFGGQFEQIKKNIENNNYFLSGVVIDEESLDLKRELYEKKDTIERLCEKLLNVTDSPLTVDFESLEKVVIDAIGREETIRLKIQDGVRVTNDDAQYLLNIIHSK